MRFFLACAPDARSVGCEVPHFGTFLYFAFQYVFRTHPSRLVAYKNLYFSAGLRAFSHLVKLVRRIRAADERAACTREPAATTRGLGGLLVRARLTGRPAGTAIRSKTVSFGLEKKAEK